jgi:hypothetical protein
MVVPLSHLIMIIDSLLDNLERYLHGVIKFLQPILQEQLKYYFLSKFTNC